jgi:hypothetical protein
MSMVRLVLGNYSGAALEGGGVVVGLLSGGPQNIESRSANCFRSRKNMNPT